MTVVTLPAKHKPEGVSFYVDDKLLKQLDKIKKRVQERDEDYFWAVDGEEGSGKSTFVMQLAKYVDPSFDLSRVVFTANDLQRVIVGASKGQAVVFDEAFRGLSSRAALGEMNRMLVQLMMECRQRNLFVFVVLPTFFLLDRYVALWRAKGLFHVYRRKDQRGFWMYFNKKKKKMLYLMGHKTMSYGKPRTEFRGRFFNQYVVDEEEYREMKSKAFKSSIKKLKSEELLQQRNILLFYAVRKMGMTTYELSDELAKLGWKIKQNTISEIVNLEETKGHQ